MRISFIAVNYNNSSITINYVQNILLLRNSDVIVDKIIIIDNCSEDDDYINLRNSLYDIEKVVILRTQENIGYFGGLNKGLAQVNIDSIDFVIAGNNDLIFERDLVIKLSNKKYDKDSLVIVPDLITIAGIHQNPHFRHKVSKTRLLCWRLYYSNYFFACLIKLVMAICEFTIPSRKNSDYKVSGNIFLCIGACFIVTQSFLVRCKTFDQLVFLWEEEAVLANQIKKAGGFLFYDADLKVYHLEHASISKIPTRKKYDLYKQSFKVTKDFYR